MRLELINYSLLMLEHSVCEHALHTVIGVPVHSGAFASFGLRTSQAPGSSDTRLTPKCATTHYLSAAATSGAIGG